MQIIGGLMASEVLSILLFKRQTVLIPGVPKFGENYLHSLRRRPESAKCSMWQYDIGDALAVP